jgi:hypothetical protein
MSLEREPSEEVIGYLRERFVLDRAATAALFKVNRGVRKAVGLEDVSPLGRKLAAVLFAFLMLREEETRNHSELLGVFEEALGAAGIGAPLSREVLSLFSVSRGTDAEDAPLSVEDAPLSQKESREAEFFQSIAALL